jgi:hypothetical protein
VQKPQQDTEAKLLGEDEKKAYFREKLTQGPNSQMWRWTLKNSTRRSMAYSSGQQTNHVVWMIDSKDSTINGPGPKSQTYKHLTAQPGTPEHAALLEGEKMLMQAFMDAKNLLPEKDRHWEGFVVTRLGDNTGMSTGTILGMSVNSLNTDELLQSLVAKNKNRAQDTVSWLKGAFAHEMTHNIRGKLDDNIGDNILLNTNEVPSHANQYLSTWNENQAFFNTRVNSLKLKQQPMGRIHAELGGLRLVQTQLNAREECQYKPKDFTPAELTKAIQSIPEEKRTEVLRSMVAENLKTPPQKYQQLVRDVYDTFEKST